MLTCRDRAFRSTQLSQPLDVCRGALCARPTVPHHLQPPPPLLGSAGSHRQRRALSQAQSYVQCGQRHVIRRLSSHCRHGSGRRAVARRGPPILLHAPGSVLPAFLPLRPQVCAPILPHGSSLSPSPASTSALSLVRGGVSRTHDILSECRHGLARLLARQVRVSSPPGSLHFRRNPVPASGAPSLSRHPGGLEPAEGPAPSSSRLGLSLPGGGALYQDWQRRSCTRVRIGAWEQWLGRGKSVGGACKCFLQAQWA